LERLHSELLEGSKKVIKDTEGGLIRILLRELIHIEAKAYHWKSDRMCSIQKFGAVLGQNQ